MDHARIYGGLDRQRSSEPGQFYCTTGLPEDIKRLERPSPLFRLRRIGDEPAGEAAWFISLYALFLAQPAPPDALIAVSDSQNRAGAQDAADRAARYIRDALAAPIPVAFGVPHCDAEGWFVAALTGGDPGHSAARQELNLDPLREPHRLTAQPNTAVRDAKRVLRFLIGAGRATLASTPTGALSCAEYEDLAEAWTAADLARLQAHDACGLAAFIQALREVIAPAVLPGPTG